jgi:Na+/H+ antiporter NhaD/arsenite permease-like protein
MSQLRKISLFAVLLVGIGLLWLWPFRTAQPGLATVEKIIIGAIHDTQNEPVSGATISLLDESQDQPLAETTSQPDGTFTLPLGEVSFQAGHPYRIQIERAHFANTQIDLGTEEITTLENGETLVLQDITLPRKVDLSFWIATLLFAGVLILIAIGKLHNTLASLLGAALVFAVSYLGQPLSPDLFIFNFQRALTYVDWNVIFLIMGMMIVIAVIERTGIFQWLAYMAYRLSGGRTWLLMAILMVITGIASAFLDNVTTMLLMTPITVQIALSLGANPLALLLPEVFASNVVGIITLIGTPTNILIGSYANISFNDFLTNLSPGVLLALIGLIIYCEIIFRKGLETDHEAGVSPLLLEKLAERAEITEPDHLKKAGVVGAGMLALFIFGEHVHLVPAVTALLGATALLVWIRPDIEEMIEAVDWTTLVFFITLFICVGAVQEVGLIAFIADGIGRLVGENLVLTILAIIWLSAILSTVIANIPFTAAMLPVVRFLTATVPGADSKVLYYCLSVGSAMGGNGSLIGASANMVTAGISDRAGYPITYVDFLKKGFPALLITVGLATLWIFIRF